MCEESVDCLGHFFSKQVRENYLFELEQDKRSEKIWMLRFGGALTVCLTYILCPP
jgi:hypothetical protein